MCDEEGLRACPPSLQRPETMLCEGQITGQSNLRSWSRGASTEAPPGAQTGTSVWSENHGDQVGQKTAAQMQNSHKQNPSA